MKQSICQRLHRTCGSMAKKATAAVSVILLTLLLTSCQRTDGQTKAPDQSTPEHNQTTAAPQTSQPQTEQSEAESSGRESAIQAEALYGSYFKAGDFGYHMEISPRGINEKDILSVVFSSKRTTDPEYAIRSNVLTILHEFHLPFMKDAALYDLSDLNSEHGSAYTIELNPDGTVSLRGDTLAAGDYYAYEGNLILPDALNRPLNAADLIGLDKEQMRLLRNEFYALYGRIFQTEKVKSYFESQPWYRGTIPAGQFDDNVLGGMLKRNAAFLKASEDTYEEEQAQSQQTAYENLKTAPYLDLLPAHGEFSVTIKSDPSHAADEGIYYRAKGTISVPVTVTPAQYEALESGRDVEIAMDAAGKEISILKKLPDSFYSLIPAGSEKEEYGNYDVMLFYEPFLKVFCMSRNSADTIFMEIYAGDIFVLKGATEEYLNYFDFPANRAESAGSFRIIDFEETEGAGEALPYSGNMPVFDSKGYLKALNYWGD